MILKGLSFGKRDIIKNTFPNDRTLFKYYTGYMHKGGVIPLSIQFPQVTGYSKHFNADSKYINVLVTNEKLLKECNEIWDKIKSLFKKRI